MKGNVCKGRSFDFRNKMKNKKYHTVRTVLTSYLKYHTVRTVLTSILKYHTIRIVLTSSKMEETCNIETPNTCTLKFNFLAWYRHLNTKRGFMIPNTKRGFMIPNTKRDFMIPNISS